MLLGGTHLVYHPEPGVDTSTQGVTATVKKWGESTGLPGFKSQI
ncbi:hypothetical protein EQV93_16120 [Pseudomonas sp. TMW22091]|uniref:Uncharacterized protein n=1 Tax=Pseudomonas saxonica TaxID=2600598 RepID=A0ABY3GE98_9PSED|nr:hypothetical protein [Pseudomonas sp. TMW22091]TWR86827.1 hypothetical protein FJD38_19900 [Pseudomonas saxonica]